MAYTVSSLTPSRDRPELLKSSIESLGKLKEHLVYVDEDDPQLEEYKKLKIPGMKMVIGKRHNYYALQNYYNELAEMATGDWLLIWNDDAVMHTEDWTQHIQEYDPQKPAVLNIHFENNNYFPLVSRKFYETLGHISLSPHNDSWVQEIAQALDIHYNAFEHIKTEHIRDQLEDATMMNSKAIAQDTGFEHANMRNREMRDDIEKLRQL